MQLILAPGASGNATSMRPWIDALAERGVSARAIDIPKRRAEEAVGAYLALSGQGPEIFIGGQSYGGRVASLVAARDEVAVGGLVLLSYPLHRPGTTEWESRVGHWSDIRCPVLLLSGEADPFARLELLRRAVESRLPDAELHTWPRVGHGLRPVLDEAADRVAAFLRGDRPSSG